MKLSTKILGACVLAPALAVGAFTAVSAATPATPGVADRAAAPAAPAAPSAVTTLDTSEEISYVPITPCRIVDTRSGGGSLGPGVVRSFAVSGSSGFSAQGGTSSGCAVPSAATAINAIVTATSPTVPSGSSSGTLRAWPAASSEPTVGTIMNYANKVNLSTGTTLAITPAANPALKMHNLTGTTQLIIDIQGYYLPPIQADITGNGSFYAHSPRVLSVAHTGTGYYTVTVDRAVIGRCSAQVAPVSAGYFAAALTAGSNAVSVRTSYLVSGTVTNVDAEFNFNVSC